MDFIAEPVGHGGPTTPIDWPTLKKEIVGRTSILDEYESMGVKFTSSITRSSGWRECRAVDRDDNKPSAAVNVLTGVYKSHGDGAEVLGFFDFALKYGGGRYGNTWVEVLSHFADKAGVPMPESTRHGDKGHIEAVYTYCNDMGQPAYEVVRYRRDDGSKTFRQRRPDKTGHGYIWNLNGVEAFPYRLPQLLEAEPDGHPVWIVEGEKDAERLAALGLSATTNHQGSGNTKVWEKIGRWLAKRDVFIIPDQDSVGFKHAHGVAAFLKEVARCVKIVQLPRLAPHGDVSDWLDAGNTLDDLTQLAIDAPVWEPGVGTSAEDLSRDATAADLRTILSSTAWCWTNWIPAGCLTIVAAEPGVGKTRFCMDLAKRVYFGLPWPDGSAAHFPPGTPTLWIPADNQHQELVDIPDAYGFPAESIYLNTTAEDVFAGTGLETAQELADFEARIKRVKPGLVFIDTITQTSDLKSHDPSDAKKQYKPLQQIAQRTQTAIVCVTHLNAGGKVLGRRAVEKARVVIQLESPDPENSGRLRLWVSKSKALKPGPLGVSMDLDGNTYDDKPPERAEEGGGGPKMGHAPAKVQECIDWLTVRLSQGATRVSVIRKESDGRGYSARTLYAARDTAEIEEFEDQGRKWWRLTANEDVDFTPF